MRDKHKLVRRGSAALSAAALLAVGLAPGAADAVTTTAGEATAGRCTMELGSVTAGGDHRSQRITANSPPTRTNDHVVAPGLFPDRIRLSTAMASSPDEAFTGGMVISGATMSYIGYALVGGRLVDRNSIDREIHTGDYGDIVALDLAHFREGTSAPRVSLYGLRSDGLLLRWVSVPETWRVTGAYPGFAPVKTMTLISKTRYYDTFLANTHRGALYTIRVARTASIKPVVKRVRARTWQGFEHLLAQKCGKYGTLLLGIDKDTRSAHLYAVGHANGTATVIQSLGKVPGMFSDPTYFRFTPLNDPHVGE